MDKDSSNHRDCYTIIVQRKYNHLSQTYCDHMQNTIDTNVLVIGAGPCGLFQVFQLGLQGIGCHVIEALPHPGGQCVELYADKPIYDIPGIPHILAGELTTQLLAQIKPFSPVMHYQQTVIEVSQTPQGGFMATTSSGKVFSASNIVLAAGAGAFNAVKMRVDGINAFENSQLFYSDISEPLMQSASEKMRVVVIGDTPDAIDAAIQTSPACTQLTYVHRKRRLSASPQALASLQTHIDAKRIELINGKITGFTTDDTNKKISHLSVVDNNKQEINLPVDYILARLGNSPKLNNFSDWNLQTTRHNINVEPACFQSNLPGFYVIGDINFYPGKRKLILCGFHEATLAAFDIAAKLKPDKPVHTQYTTTSTELQQRLGLT